MPGEHCSSACPTKDHHSFGACLKAKGVKVGWCRTVSGLDFTAEKKRDKELADYRDARKTGVQPASTRPRDVHGAMDISSRTGKAFQA